MQSVPLVLPVPPAWSPSLLVTALNPPKVERERPVVNRARYEYWLRRLREGRQ